MDDTGFEIVPPPGIAGRFERVFARLGRVSYGQMFVFTVLWVIAGGLLLQLLVLPRFAPRAHWGHGIIADTDSHLYHEYAVERSEQIQRSGWSTWELRPYGQMPAGIASVLYVLVHPEPWIVLPLNGILFAIVVVSVRRLLAVLFESERAAVASVMPFFAFPSFIPIWGQLQKDIVTGAGLAVVLCALTLAAQRRRAPGLPTLGIVTALAMALVWLPRPYGLWLVAGVVLAGASVAVLARQCARLRVAAVSALVLAAALAGGQPWSMRPLPVARKPPPATAAAPSPNDVTSARQPTAAPLQTPKTHPDLLVKRWQLPFPRRRVIEAGTPTYGACAPFPRQEPLDRALYAVCMTREGFIGDAERYHAASGVDYDVRLRTLGDLVAYLPSGLALAVLEPAPQRWGAERSPIGRLASWFVRFEMSFAYLAFAGALVWGRSKLRRVSVLAVITSSVLYCLVFVLTMPQLGTVYRMRAFAFAILVSCALAAMLSSFSVTRDDPATVAAGRHDDVSHRWSRYP